MHMMPQEIVLALVLVDLPIELDLSDDVKVKEGFGTSWAYLTSECDDAYSEVVEEVLSLCTYSQAREMCFSKVADKTSIISRASPKCKEILKRSLRFVGRFEFLGTSAVSTDLNRGIKVFDALDFGDSTEPIHDGKHVLLKCYNREDLYMDEVSN